MKFQTGPLRKILGSEAEWLFPDGQEPWQSAADASDPEMSRLFRLDPALAVYYAERSPFEVRIAQGQPFVSWFKITVDDAGAPIAEPDSFERAIAWLTDYVARESPIDVLISFAQGNMVCSTLAMRMMASGKEVPWKLSCAFNPTPLADREATEFEAAKVTYPQVAFIVTSPLDPMYLAIHRVEVPRYKNVEVLEHQEGLGFPVRPPTSTEIYERLASEIRRHCGLSAPVEPTLQQKRQDWAARLAKYRALGEQSAGSGAAADPRLDPTGTAGSALDTAAREESEDSGSEEESFEVEAITAQTLAQMLRDRICIIADVERRGRSLPGMEKDDISFVTLRMVPAQARRALTRLKEDSRRLVAVSVAGEQCQEYCKALVKQFGFQADRLCVLAGGLRSWDVWEVESPEASNELRAAYDLPLLRGTPVESVGAEALAELLLLRACLVVDARETEETRRQAFPSAQKDISLLMLTKRPHQVKRKLASLREDGRPLVAVSGTGLRCRRYCSLLVDEFGFDVDKVCWLEGGICRWEEWEQEHAEASQDIRQAYGLPSLRARPREEARHAQLRERSLDLLA